MVLGETGFALHRGLDAVRRVHFVSLAGAMARVRRQEQEAYPKVDQIQRALVAVDTLGRPSEVGPPTSPAGCRAQRGGSLPTSTPGAADAAAPGRAGVDSAVLLKALRPICYVRRYSGLAEL